MKNRNSFILCFIGGILLISVGAVGSIGFFEMLTLITEIPALSALAWLIEILLYVLGFIAGLGGLGVIIGGYMLTTERIGTGKFVVGLAMGMSLVGLIVHLIQTLYFYGVGAVLNFLSLAAQSIGWIGIFISIAGRRSANSE